MITATEHSQIVERANALDAAAAAYRDKRILEIETEQDALYAAEGGESCELLGRWDFHHGDDYEVDAPDEWKDGGNAREEWQRGWQAEADLASKARQNARVAA